MWIEFLSEAIDIDTCDCSNRCYSLLIAVISPLQQVDRLWSILASILQTCAILSDATLIEQLKKEGGNRKLTAKEAFSEVFGNSE